MTAPQQIQITPVIAEHFLQRVPLEEALKGYPDYADVLRAAWERIPVEKRAGGIAEQPKQSLPQAGPQQQLPEPRGWEIPAHREVDPFDPEYDEVMAVLETKSIPDAAIENKPETIPQPDANGEFASPLDGGLWMAIVHHKRQFPLNGRRDADPDEMKKPLAGFTEWEKRATTDPAQIRQWAAEYPGCGFGSVADDGQILEIDSPRVRERFGKTFSRTLTVLSSLTEAGWKSHRYYLPADTFSGMSSRVVAHVTSSSEP